MPRSAFLAARPSYIFIEYEAWMYLKKPFQITYTSDHLVWRSSRTALSNVRLTVFPLWERFDWWALPSSQTTIILFRKGEWSTNSMVQRWKVDQAMQQECALYQPTKRRISFRKDLEMMRFSYSSRQCGTNELNKIASRIKVFLWNWTGVAVADNGICR